MADLIGKLSHALKDGFSASEDDSLAGFQEWAAQTHGSPNEFRVFMDLRHRGMSPGVDFKFQADRLGGLSHVGDAKIQFFLPLGKIIIRVQGLRWADEKASEHTNDMIQKLMWTGRGWYVADFLADEVQANVHRVVSLALQLQMTPRAQAVLRG